MPSCRPPEARSRSPRRGDGDRVPARACRRIQGATDRGVRRQPAARRRGQGAPLGRARRDHRTTAGPGESLTELSPAPSPTWRTPHMTGTPPQFPAPLPHELHEFRRRAARHARPVLLAARTTMSCRQTQPLVPSFRLKSATLDFGRPTASSCNDTPYRSEITTTPLKLKSPDERQHRATGEGSMVTNPRPPHVERPHSRKTLPSASGCPDTTYRPDRSTATWRIDRSPPHDRFRRPSGSVTGLNTKSVGASRNSPGPHGAQQSAVLAAQNPAVGGAPLTQPRIGSFCPWLCPSYVRSCRRVTDPRTWLRVRFPGCNAVRRRRRSPLWQVL